MTKLTYLLSIKYKKHYKFFKGIPFS